MAKIDYTNWSQKDLITEIERLKKRKKYGLVWEDKPEDVVEQCKQELPVLEDVPDKEIKTDPDKPINLLIEGDNYHALSVLNYTHKGKVDVIYIDPPYNTGAKDWKYNNHFVDSEDPWRHSKWVSMMSKRLVLAKKLLKKNGALICAIDDYELNTLGLLLDEIFPSHEKSTIVVEHHPQGAGSVTISRTHEYAYIIIPKGIGIEGRKTEVKKGRWSLRRSGQGENNWRVNRPNQFFSILIDLKTHKVVGVGPSIPKDDEKYPTKPTQEGYLRIYPVDRNGGERVWRYNRETMQKYIEEGDIEYTKNGALVIKKMGAESTPIFSVWKGSLYNAGVHGTNLLSKIIGKTETFPYPKSLYTVSDMIDMFVKHKKNAIVLDFFAGSGTTAHAVLEINKIDGGNRKFILSTNDEGNIATDVCYPRIKKVIEGYKNAQGKVEGFGGNLKYFRTAFVPAEPTDSNKTELTNKATDMLCIREDTFELVADEEQFKIFKGKEHYTGIIFNQLAIPEFKKAITKIDLPFSVYVFSLGDDTFEDEFADMNNKVALSPIPEAILRVYRRIFK
ncbi:MAG: DNA methyltransferase [Candidatus Omnitrophota bacterium]|jgi:adenine-specific DNA-methyltransferase